MSDLISKNAIWVDLGDGAQACTPRAELEWKLRYTEDKEGVARSVAASAIASLRYLILECSQKEQVCRLSLMKKSLISLPETNNQ